MPETKPSTAKVVAAFASVYVIWGSTYLAIRYAIQTLPPLLMASSRFLIGGVLLYGWARWRGAKKPTRQGWKHASVLGFMLMFCGNGAVVVAEKWVPSGLTAVLVATVSLWVVIFSWLRPGGRRPSAQVAFGIVMGLVGVTMLIGIGNLRGAGTVEPMGAVILIFSTMSWAGGSIYAQKAHISDSPLQTSGMQMMTGGIYLLVGGLLTGEASRFNPSAVSAVSVFALAYLIFFGAIIAFTAYSWLLKATSPQRASTYAYVNPAVAVVLGWAIAGEALTPRMILAMCIIVAAVMVITMAKRQTS